MNDLTLSIVGSGGEGAVAAGDILSMACARDGLNVLKTEAYGPQIRGGESSCTVRISSSAIHAQGGELKRARRLQLGGLRAIRVGADAEG